MHPKDGRVSRNAIRCITSHRKISAQRTESYLSQGGNTLYTAAACWQVLSSEKDWKAKSRVVGRVYVTLVSGMLVYMVGYSLVQVVRERRQFQVQHIYGTAERAKDDFLFFPQQVLFCRAVFVLIRCSPTLVCHWTVLCVRGAGHARFNERSDLRCTLCVTVASEPATLLFFPCVTGFSLARM